MPSIMFIASGCKSVSSFIAEHAGTPCHGKAAFSATHALKPCSMFGASVAMRHATGRGADAQSGCLSFGSLLTQQQRQNATRHRHVAGRPAAASDLAGARARSTNMQHAARARWQHASCKAAVSAMVCRPRPKSLAAVQNVAIQIQGSVAMHGGADDFLDYLEVVHVFIRGSAASRAALHQVGQTYWVDHSPARLSNEERAQELVP